MPIPEIASTQEIDVTLSWDDVVGFAPELSVLTSIQAQVALQTAQDEVMVAAWGTAERVQRAALYLCCHIGTLMRIGMWGQPLNDVQVGQVKKSFKQRPDKAWEFDQTRYGMEYQRLMRLYLPRFALGA